MPIIEIEWYEHPQIRGVDDFVKKEFDKKCSSSYHDTTSKDAYSIQDYRKAALHWIEDQMSMLEALEEKVKVLPLDAREKIMVLEDMLED